MKVKQEIIFDDLPKNTNLITGTFKEKHEDEESSYRFRLYRSGNKEITWIGETPENPVSKGEILKSFQEN